MIRQQLAARCPSTMTPAELDSAADYVMAHPDALTLVQRLDRFDQESAICRGQG